MYGYYADITDLFGSGQGGSYTITLVPPPDPTPDSTPQGSLTTWFGATVTVVYDTTPCDQISELVWKTGADYYYGEGTTPHPRPA